MTGEVSIDYEALAQDAMRGIVRTALRQVGALGYLPGEHHFYIAFDTRASGVVLSKRLKERYPEEMTIVLQHQFRNLVVDDEHFEVTLSFDGKLERLAVPLRAVRVFFDPSVPYGLQFDNSDLAARPADEADAPVPEAADGDELRPEVASATGVRRRSAGCVTRAWSRAHPPRCARRASRAPDKAMPPGRCLRPRPPPTATTLQIRPGLRCRARRPAGRCWSSLNPTSLPTTPRLCSSTNSAKGRLAGLSKANAIRCGGYLRLPMACPISLRSVHSSSEHADNAPLAERDGRRSSNPIEGTQKRRVVDALE